MRTVILGGEVDMIDIRISYEEFWLSDTNGTITGYFTIDKSLLEDFRPEQYPEAEYGELSVEYPINHPEASNAIVMISPTKDGSDYDWTAIELSNELIEELILITEFRSRL